MSVNGIATERVLDPFQIAPGDLSTCRNGACDKAREILEE
jgi:hypothetical protein